MPKRMLCPYFEREIEHHKQRIGVKCKGGEIKFSDKEIKREFVYPLCGSADKGYIDCPMYKTLHNLEGRCN